jgi:PPM family protein phosphatase
MTIVDIPKVQAHGRSETGKVREDNQDSIRLYQPDDPQILASHGYMFALADGMGGYSHGGVASATALEIFFTTYYGSGSGQPVQKLKQAFQQANLGVYQASQRLGAIRMGTTLSAAAIVGNQLYITHAGDSRIYLIRDNKATCLTNDHTMVGDLVRMKVLSPDKIRSHSQRSILNKCLGLDLFVQPDVSQHTLRDGDILLLCCDGVWAVIQDDVFADVAASAPDTDVLCNRLVELALENDSDDNTSAVAVHVQQLPPASPQTTPRRTLGLPGFLRNRLSGNV